MAFDLAELKRALTAQEMVVLTAPPGTGKTTRIPPALLDEPWLKGKKILVLEPRRLAARRAAQYMAAQRGESVGETIGYHVRLERCCGPHTRIEFLTEGLLTQRLLADLELSEVGLVVFDEFHERSLTQDLGFALTQEIRATVRPDLRLLLMSATVQSTLLPEATFIEIPAVAYPVEISYLGELAPVAAIMKAVREEDGSILCFLPGEGEIRSVAEKLRLLTLPSNVVVTPLYAALDRHDQDLAVAPPLHGQRKIVLATSIAESSLTIEGIRVVIDSGWARLPKFAPRNGLTRLVTQRISQDRATQRTGRAGRLCPGHCYRLWDESTQRTLVPQVQPEMMEADLTQTALICAEWGSYELKWLTAPPPSAWNRAREALRALEATDAKNHITELGHAMVRFPVHPALASMMLRMRTLDRGGGALLAAICSEAFKLTEFRNIADFQTVVEQVLRNRPREIWQLAERWAGGNPTPRLSVEELVPYLLYAFPGHLAYQRDRTSGRYLTAAGFGAVLPKNSPLINAQWLLAVQMSDDDKDATIRCATALNECSLSLCHQETRLHIEWDAKAKKLIAAEEKSIGAIILRSRPLQKIPPEAYAQALRCQLNHQGLPWNETTRAIAQRIAFLRHALPQDCWPTVDDETLVDGLIDMLNHKSVPTASDLLALIQFQIVQSGHTVREMDIEAPVRFEVPSGSQIRIRYDGAQPYIAVKIQEVFGLQSTPKIAKGRIPLLLHLLSPAQRPVQITQDLASFWATGYALVRKDLRGRYPRHTWPEDPTQAIASRRTLQK
ncbi:MAG: ATP-dependent helicase HrpB [Kiritimatiellia bacterium]